MSNLRFIKTNSKPDIPALFSYLKQLIPMLEVEQKSESLFYFWEKFTSSRGVDLSIEGENWLELRNTVCSNSSDYNISNFILKLLIEIHGGAYYIENPEYDDEDENSIEYLECSDPFYLDKTLLEIRTNEADTIVTLLKAGKQITLHGPKRKIHFGKFWLDKLKGDTPLDYAYAIEKTIFKVNNTEPTFEYGNIMKVGNNDEAKNIKLITNQVNCIIDKYNYVCFQKNKDEMILITNDDLNTILPKSWKRLDEYTVVAPMLSEEDFSALLTRAEVMNREHELRN